MINLSVPVTMYTSKEPPSYLRRHQHVAKSETGWVMEVVNLANGD